MDPPTHPGPQLGVTSLPVLSSPPTPTPAQKGEGLRPIAPYGAPRAGVGGGERHLQRGGRPLSPPRADGAAAASCCVRRHLHSTQLAAHGVGGETEVRSPSPSLPPPPILPQTYCVAPNPLHFHPLRASFGAASPLPPPQAQDQVGTPHHLPRPFSRVQLPHHGVRQTGGPYSRLPCPSPASSVQVFQ